MQLVAYGAQDIYLTGNPQITFFKVVYRRHTNFSMETIEQTINGTPSFGGNSSVTISRNGDLVYKVYVTLAATSTTEGSDIISEVELEIGGQRIDRQYKEWMQIWEELSTPESKAIGLKSMKCDIGIRGDSGVGMLQIPLEFWFCRNPGLALPLIALQYHEVKLKFTWGGTTSPVNAKVWCDYIYLDTDERRRFAQVSHEYLIEQLQKEDKNTASKTHTLNFNHPVKELIWTTAAAGNYTKANIKLNGHDRFALQDTEYFQLRQPYEFHTAVPRQNLPTSAQLTTLDRQTELTEIQVAGPASLGAMTDAAPGGEGPGIYTFDVTGGSLGDQMFSVQHAFNEPLTGALAAGDQIAIVCSASGTGLGTGLIGKTYFANVLKTKINGPVLEFTTTTPTEALTSSPDTIHSDSTAASGVLHFFKVTNGNSAQARTSQMTKNINVYSFALKPEEHQPSGTCNFSRIDTAQLIFETQLACTVYAVNYNVLRIMSGMGGLAYSN